jgi:glycosyltransferase involved in cell wall biosynthesis
MTPDVDVVVPVRKGGRLLRDAVDSVLAQEQVRVRVVVVDDGSNDRAVQRLPADPRILTVEGPARGIPLALNTGIEKCGAPYVARQDADDISLPGRLVAEVDYLETNAGIGLVATAFEVVVGDRVVTTTTPAPVRMLDKNPICAGSTVVRRSILDELGGYRRVFAFSSDYDMWLRCAATSGVAILPIVGYRYRLSAQMTTVRNASRQVAYAELARVSARARLAGLSDPADGVSALAGDPTADTEVAAWWAQEFAALGAWREAAQCLRHLPARRAARVLAHLLPRPRAQVAWT